MTEFEIKGGRCTITSEEIVIKNSLAGFFKQMYKIKPAVFLSIVGVGVVLSYLAVFERNFFAAAAVVLAVAIFGVWLAFNVTYGYIHDLSYDRRIPRERIMSVTPVEAATEMMVHRFTIEYEMDGTEKTRYLYMPSKAGTGNEEFERAKEIFRSEDIPFEENCCFQSE